MCDCFYRSQCSDCFYYERNYLVHSGQRQGPLDARCKWGCLNTFTAEHKIKDGIGPQTGACRLFAHAWVFGTDERLRTYDVLR